MKLCFKCKKEKPLSEFYIHSQMADGHLNKCKECTIGDVLIYRELNIEKVRKYDRERAKTKHRKEINKKYNQSKKGKRTRSKASKKWSINNPNKRTAMKILYDAIRTGDIKKEACEVCGCMDGVHAHHGNYRFPLKVNWLCPKHHAELHKNLNSKRS